VGVGGKPCRQLLFIVWYSCEEKYIKITNLFKQKAENQKILITKFFKKDFASEEKYIKITNLFKKKAENQKILITKFFRKDFASEEK